MRYLRTTLGTEWEKEKEFSVRVLEKLFWFVPKANPGYEQNLHLVNEWLIEFDNDLPIREIGIDQSGSPILAGSSESDYGFWLDTNMKYQDFTGVSISEDEFEKMWKVLGNNVVS